MWPFEMPASRLKRRSPHLGRGSGELAEGLVDLGEQGRVVGRVAAREGPGGGLLAVVPDPPGPAVLLDEAGDLGPRVARHLLDEALYQALLIPLEAMELEADQRPADEVVGGGPAGEPEVRRLATVQEGPDLVESAYPFGAKCHDHPPMISSPRASGLSVLFQPSLQGLGFRARKGEPGPSAPRGAPKGDGGRAVSGLAVRGRR